MATPSRPIASLTISFGLVAIPVKLYSATVASERIAFHLLRKSDGSRIKERFVAVKDGKPVERADMVKGFEFAKGKHVVFAPEELKRLEQASSSELNISQFVPFDSVDPVYFGSTYYVLPDKGGTKPYALLATALRQEERCAVGKWIARGREHVVIIRAVGNGLALHQLHFEAEVRRLEDFGRDFGKVSEAEVKLARQLIEQLTAKRFDPAEFVDEYHARVKAQIKKKMQGKEVSLAELEPRSRPDNVVSLMDALKKSLQHRSASALAAKKPKKAAAKRARKSA